MKALMVMMLVLIVASLGSALGSMSQQTSGTAQSLRTVQALTARIALSVGLFALLIAGYYLGWIEPHGLR